LGSARSKTAQVIGRFKLSPKSSPTSPEFLHKLPTTRRHRRALSEDSTVRAFPARLSSLTRATRPFPHGCAGSDGRYWARTTDPSFVEHRIRDFARIAGGRTRQSQAPTRHCAEICSHARKQKARVRGPFEVGGTGLEPVTPSLSSEGSNHSGPRSSRMVKPNSAGLGSSTQAADTGRFGSIRGCLGTKFAFVPKLDVRLLRQDSPDG
jgi:hypothetical protein